MKIQSPAFSHNESMPKQFSREGGDKSPPLVFEEVPANAKSLVLIMDDPDAPNRTFNHWILFNVPANVEDIREDAPPIMASQGRNDYGEIGYGGPKPPSGEHRYFFRLYALDAELPLLRGARRGEVEAAMQGHILEQAELMGRFAAQLEPAEAGAV